jgi:hypothetical protein
MTSSESAEAWKLEHRLGILEHKLGILHGKADTRGKAEDLEHRLNEIKSLYEANTNESFRESCSESDRLVRELDAGTALTHQTSVSSTPLYYRRQEVLSSSEDLKADMDQLSQLLNLLLVGQPAQEGQKNLSEEEITRAPILNLKPISKEEEQRLDLVQANLKDLQMRTQNVAGRVDALLKLYSSLMTTSSEKIVMADEEISAREQKK